MRHARSKDRPPHQPDPAASKEMRMGACRRERGEHGGGAQIRRPGSYVPCLPRTAFRSSVLGRIESVGRAPRPVMGA